MVKGEIYNFQIPYRVELAPKSWLYKVIGEAKFSVTVVIAGKLRKFSNITNDDLSRYPLTGILITKCPRGTIIKIKDGE